MNVNQRMALAKACPDGHGAAEGKPSPIHRVAECVCGWRCQFPRRGRNALATTSMIHGAILAHYREVTARAPVWTVTPNASGEWEYHDGTRLRAILEKRHRTASPWTVHAVSSRGRVTGCDTFKTRAEAHTFITNGRIFR